jgi:type IV secretion system protein TrbE
MEHDSLAAVVPYRSLPKEGEADLRGNGVMIGYELRGPSPESSTLADVASASRQLAAAFMHLGTGDMVHVIYHRQPAPEPPERTFPSHAAALVHAEHRAQFAAESHWLTPTRLYLTHQYEPPTQSIIRAALFAASGPQRQGRHELLREYALSRFAAFEDAAASAILLRRLSNVELFRDLLMCVTYHDYPALLPAPQVRLNEVIGCERFYGGVQPYINGFHLRPVCITAYPTYTVPQILAVLLRHPGRMTVSARFICNDTYDAQQQLRLERQHWNRDIIGSVWKTVKGWFGKDHKADLDSQAQLAEIDAAIAAAAAGTTFGWATITAVVRDHDPDRAELRARDLVKECHALGLMARLEDANAVEAIMSTWAGNGSSNVRKPIITGANFADVVLPVEHWAGLPYIDSPFYPDQTPTPLICGGTGHEPFWLPTHINGVANQLIIGPTGSGKSGLIGAMVCAYLGVPAARITWLDLDYSSFVLAHLLGEAADYRDMGAQDTPALCPLAFLDQPDGLEWLFGWFERLFARWNFELDERQSEEFAFCLREARRTGVRTMSGLRALIPGEQVRIRRILRHYTTYWKHIFDGEPGTAANKRVNVYEMRGLMGLGKRAAAPATEFILHSIISALDGSPTWIFADEFWALLGDEVSAEWLFDSIRTVRKRNCGFIGSSQSLTEIVNSPYRDLLLESCPGKILLPNSEARGEYVREAYYKLGLNEHEVAILSSASPQRQYLYRSPIGSRLFTLALGDLAKNICAATGYKDVQLARRLLAESPNGHFLDAWLGERLPGRQYSLPITPEAQAAAGR